MISNNDIRMPPVSGCRRKATPIREGVIVIESGTSMDQLRDFATRCEAEFGIKAFQIHMHKDEGNMNSKEW
ncbi:hypothetical protein NXX97_22605 [Bacteroides fragilis]|nr:hypothetical protein [Bacteroides fragilis]